MKKHTIPGKLFGAFIAVILIVLLAFTVQLFSGNEKYSEVENEITLLHESMDQLSAENERLGLQNAALSTENTALETENEQLQNQLSEMSEVVKEKEAVIISLEEEKLTLTESLSSVRERSEFFVYEGLVRVLDIDASLVIDLRYATDDNFTGQRVYPEDAPALLNLDTALKLKRANERFEKDGFRIKIWDGYRPKSVQEIFWDLVPDPKYVADPAKGSIHNRGASVDVTLVDFQGRELEMPTAFDDFSVKASRDYQGSSENARENLTYLTRIMEESGFSGISTEWWHFNDKSRSYPLLDVDFEVFY